MDMIFRSHVGACVNVYACASALFLSKILECVWMKTVVSSVIFLVGIT